MNEDLQKALAEFVKATLTGLQQGKDFALSQAPDLIQQLLRWKFWQYTLCCVLDMLVIVLALVFVPRLVEAQQTRDSYDFPLPGALAGVLGILGLVVIVAFMIDGANLVELCVAPKVWLLEWALQMVKS